MVDFTGGTWRSLIDGQEVSAIPDGLVDNFENADADPAGVYETGETIADYYSQDTADFARTTETVFNGGHALEATSDNVDIVSTPGDGLPNYPSQPVTIEYYYYTVPGSSGGCNIIAQNGDGYLCQPRHRDSDLRLIRRDGFGFEELASTTMNTSDNTWYRIEFEYVNDDLTATVEQTDGTEVASESATDATHSDVEGIGWSDYANGGAIVDEAFII